METWTGQGERHRALSIRELQSRAIAQPRELRVLPRCRQRLQKLVIKLYAAIEGFNWNPLISPMLAMIIPVQRDS